MNKTTDELMRLCRVGDDRCPDEINDLLAECYGRLKWQQERLRKLEAALKYWLPREMPLRGHFGPKIEEHKSKWLDARNLVDTPK